MQALSTQPILKSSPPAIVSRALDTAISKFTNALEAKPGTATRKVIPAESAPSDDERRALAGRKADLDQSLTPATEAALVRSVGALRVAFPAAGDTEENLRLAMGLYVKALSPYPEWAVNEVCRQYLEGRRGSGTFAPPAPEMAKACREEVSKFVDERAKITAVLEAEVLPPIDEEKARRAAAVMRWEKEIRPAMAAKDQPSKPAEAPEAALDRIKSEGWGSVQISPALTKILNIKTDTAA